MLGALSLIRLTIASSVEPRPYGLFPACNSAESIIRYGDAAVFRVFAAKRGHNLKVSMALEIVGLSMRRNALSCSWLSLVTM
jgi:hypothetical protein